MKKRTWIIGVAAIVVLSISCFIFWRQVGIERAKMVNLCQASVYQSLEDFKEYSARGDDCLYVYGVAEFRSFMDSYLCLNDNTGEPEYTYCSIIYGEMAVNPEKVQANIQELIEVLAILAEDYSDPNGYIRMNELGNLLRHGEDQSSYFW